MNLIPWLILTTATGACIGSFLNVVIYRLPEGRGIVTPPSACPRCGHGLAWFDNVPVLAWLWLRGKCRYCRTTISVQYPVIEATTALLFASLFVFFYMTDVRPQWRDAGVLATWPALLVHLVLLASLIAATIIDARLYIIPLSIPRVATLVAIVGLPLATLAFPQLARVHPHSHEAVAPLVGRWGIGAAAGGTLGLIIANLLVCVGKLPRSFDEPVEGERDPKWSAFAGLHRECLFAGFLVLMGIGLWTLHWSTLLPMNKPKVGWPIMEWQTALTWLAISAVAIAVFGITAALRQHKRNKAAPKKKELRGNRQKIDHGTPEEWLAYPHARREALKECLFVVWPIAGAALGAWLLPKWPFPVWLQALAGCLVGYLVGAGIVWAMRIFGSLALGKEATGLGDVHLMGAIGAVLGWRDVTMAFFMAPFFGIAAYLVLRTVGKLTHAKENVIPYGPYLAGGAVLMQIIGWRQIFAFLGIILPS